MNVAIIGAGIGGLSTALRLHAEGIRCVVYERGEQIRELGVGINVLPFATGELAELGLLDRLDETGVRTGDLVYTHRLGQEIMRRPCGLAAGFAYPQISVHRGRLQGLLHRAVLERLGADAVRTGHRLVGFEQDAEAVTARFADGSRARADVLVGADGIHSAVRSTLFPDEGPPRWGGMMLWRGATEWPEFDAGRTMVIIGGNTAKLVVYPIAAGTTPGTKLTNWSFGVVTGRPGDPPPSEQDWARPADPADLAAHIGLFTSRHFDHAAMIGATRDRFEFPMCDRDPLPYWTRDRVTLLGDAAHPMYPMGSNGAGQAILDAVNLSTHLAAHADPAEALRAYQDDRLPATAQVVLRNRLGGPEQVIEEVERRAPEGFDRIEDVIDPAELEAMVTGYTQLSTGNHPKT
ncbi:flavin-dependent oxidoreductase [Actinomadura darangshiensis]|uniref:Flavin-dependent oxidoreductase n=1 Tax=Actinomadura darangshiensis TaxID=705336 RepID=A0A4R5B649_9ACTN|nr:flavin-dependent oxidoreductase [Actinomadura darangshiensis]TDD80329.1 flavin-dependent oxidoreductase [Actinomadura darangshiensis]